MIPLLPRAPAAGRAVGIVDPLLPDLESALDAERVAALLALAWRERHGEALSLGAGETTYVRYKPGTSLVVGYRFPTEGDPSLPFVMGYGKLVPEERIGESFVKAKAIAEKRSDSRVLLLAPLPLVFHVFPFDREIPGLRQVMNRDKLKRIARRVIAWDAPTVRVSGKRTSLSLLRYKPERRALVAASLGLVDESTGRVEHRFSHVKAYADETGERTVRLMAALAGDAGAPEAPVLPEVLGYDGETRILFQETVPGEPMLRARDRVAAARAAGRGLAWLHARTVGEARAGESLAAALQEVRAAALYLERVAGGRPAGRAAALFALLERARPAPRPPSVVHGDFYHHQVLADDGRVAFVDFDEAGSGDPRLDVGNFVAHLRVEALRAGGADAGWRSLERAFLDGYREAGGLGLEALPWFSALALARLAVHPFRELRPGWRDAATAILDEGLASR